MKKTWFILLVLYFPLSFQGQQLSKPKIDFRAVDSFARSVRYTRDIYTLTKDLTDPFPDQLSKTKAIFIWITDNIKYDYKFFNSGKEITPTECKPGQNCEQVFKDWENKYLEKVIKKEKGICDGYSRLMKKMCDFAGIKSEMISGYTKTKSYQIGNPGSVNHAWNAVWLDSTWYLMDPTWAAGVGVEFNDVLVGFYKRYDDYYWMTPYDDFHRNHYPKLGKWAFEPNYTKERFAASPWFAGDVITRIKLFSPNTGMLNVRKGDTIHFKFKYTGEVKQMQVNSNIFFNPPIWYREEPTKRQIRYKEDTLAKKKQRYIDFRKQGDNYEFDYVVADPSLYYLEIIFDYGKAMRFKVKVVD